MNMKLSKVLLFAIVISLALVPDLAFASGASGGQEFQEIYAWLKGITQGVLGMLLALAAFLVGMVIGVARQSIMAFLIGVAFAIALYYGPNVIESIFGATIA